VTPLQGISTYCGSVDPGGLLVIEYFPVPNYAALTFDPVTRFSVQEFTGDLTPDGNAWFRAIVLPQDRIWNDNQINDEQGAAYERSVEAILPYHTPALAAELERMKNYRFVVRVKKRDGTGWLLNLPDNAFAFSSTFSTSPGGTQAVRHRLRWSGQVANQAWNWNF
jgi:hypothetical protein